jgi:hypothetical protein
MRTRLRGLAVSTLTVMAAMACRDDEPTPVASSPDSAPLSVFLVPEQPLAIARQPARFSFCRGDLRDGAAVGRIEDRFDTFVARVGGFQHNELSVDVVDGRAGVTHAFEVPGDAMIAFSTLPRLVERDAGERREPILLAQYVKCLLFVSADGRDRPRHSAALSARVGLPFEIVPVIDPLPLRPGEKLPLRVRWYVGTEAPFAVRVQRSARGGAGVTDQLELSTDASGTVVVPMGDPGRYLITAERETQVPGEPTRVDRAVLCFDLGAKR